MSHKKANIVWRIDTNTDWTVSHGDAQLAVLMDIRTELQRLNGILHCTNFLAIPSKLEKIRIATARIPIKKRKKKVTS